MARSQAHLEEINSQIPTLQLLINMGWQYLTPAEALHLRGGREKNVVLTGVLEPWLREHNWISYKGETYAFDQARIDEAVSKLVDEPFQSLMVTNQRLYELLTLGTSLTQTIQYDRKSYSLHYIDCQRPEHNVYHVTDEFAVEMRGSHSTRRPDIVLFVNGIPLVVIECKRSDKEYQGEKAVAEGISHMLRNQAEDQIPHLFTTSQLLMAISPNDTLYATTGTPKKFWPLWREEGEDNLPGSSATASQPEASDRDLRGPSEASRKAYNLINRPLDAGTQERLTNWRQYAGAIRAHFAALGERLPTAKRDIEAMERYLGRQYRLKVIEAEREWVKLSRGFLHVWTANKDDTERVKDLLDGWYRRQAQRVFRERLDACYPRVQKLGIPHPELVIRTLEARWGSCTPSGTVTLNLKLMQVPKACIDYGILHELCHLKEHNHSPEFYRLLDQVLPDWRERREKLNACEVA